MSVVTLFQGQENGQRRVTHTELQSIGLHTTAPMGRKGKGKRVTTARRAEERRPGRGGAGGGERKGG